jgi:hypothetical protein
MPSSRRSRRLSAAPVLALALPAAWSAAFAAQIHVTLFSQPCELQGPQDEATLQAIHAASPEQVHPPLTETPTEEQVRKGLEKLRAAKPLPAALEIYRERSVRRLEAEVAFFEGWTQARKARGADALLDAVKKHLRAGPPAAEFTTLARKLLGAAKGAPKGGAAGQAPAAEMSGGKDPFNSENQGKLYEVLGRSIEPDPEEEFHRTIRKMRVQYVCTFEETGDEE